MKLYVGTYHKYNCGSIDGAWMDLDDYDSKEEFIEACKELHSDEKDSEFMFQDFEAENTIEEQFYCESYISEKYWTEYKEAIEDCNLDLDAVGEFIRLLGYDDIYEGIKAAEDSYEGTYDNEKEYAQTTCEECYPELENIPSFIYNAIDWEHVARELSYDTEFIKTNTGDIAVFRKY